VRALVYTGPDELEVQDVTVPEMDVGDVLVRVKYAGICGTDLHLWHGGMAAVVPPVVIGHEVIGEVEAPDDPSARFSPGDRVAVEPLWTCGKCRACREGHGHVCRRLRVLGVHANGGAAEYMHVPAGRLHRIPSELSWEAAACTEPTAVAVHMTRRARIAVGDVVLVLGGGPIGFLVANVARAAGASRVLVSEMSQPRLDLCRRAGLEVIDARSQDPVDVIRSQTDDEGADVVVEAVGHPSTVATMVQAARVRGTVLVGGLSATPSPVDLATVIFKELTLVGSRVYESRDFETALALLGSGRVDASSLVTRVVPLERAVTDAFEVLRDSRDEMKVLLAPHA
jgi:(R,R)-butanediol dehydrogenase/meso-butanediol dehydrogenase/diacetyl reductase